jgi:hypothetical protein
MSSYLRARGVPNVSRLTVLPCGLPHSAHCLMRQSAAEISIPAIVLEDQEVQLVVAYRFPECRARACHVHASIS